ncbi:MAG: hypothetical protein J6K15_01820 [Lachnospiraceae bacterium]|nr:hypothetical protein [Lachnospiraceae bacterium]
MKRTTKPILFFAAVAVNILFFLLCGYGKVQIPNTASFLDPFLGAVAVALLAYGEANLWPQLYFRNKYRMLKRRTFDVKFWRQLSVIVVYYVGTLIYLAAATMIYEAGYISIFAIVLSPLWLSGGSRTLWTDHSGEGAYYLDEAAKWYKVSNVMENDDVVEIKCQAPGDRERTISIAKKKQQLDQ